MSFRTLWRRLKLGVPTLLGLARRGYFIPYRYAASDIRAGSRSPYDAVERLFADRQPVFEAYLESLDAYRDRFNAFCGAPPPMPRWGQDWFPRLDGLMAYGFVRWFRPRLIVEVGSGHSTRFMAQAAEDAGHDTAIVAIDPAPRADIRALARVALHNKPVQQVDLSVFDALQPGDILFIDSSHILMPGTDVDLLFNHVIPSLPAGVLVHIHDLFLPDDYPRSWTWRGYNEQLGVIPMVTGYGFDVEWASHFAATRMTDQVNGSCVGSIPLPDGAVETSVWLKKR